MPTIKLSATLGTSSFPSGSPTPTMARFRIFAANGVDEIAGQQQDVPIPASGPVVATYSLPAGNYTYRCVCVDATGVEVGTAVTGPFSVFPDVTRQVVLSVALG